MTTLFPYSVFQWIAVVLLLGAIAPPPLLAQSQQVCDRSGRYEPPAEVLRTIELPEFGVSVSIPANYRAMKLQDGSVQILHPKDFEWIECGVRGGISSGGSGYYFESLQQVLPDPNMSLREQAIEMMGGSDLEIIPYEQNGLEGYIVRSIYGYSVFFLGIVPNSDYLIQVSAGCDCEVDVEAVTDLLVQVRPLP
ncbi:MAG: hypothetical protein F6K42_05930 [Leptolyngbya sp. SIO1D8]|nr:hypothetical protein [Leptolyngbya sp. SIO1D8]